MKRPLTLFASAAPGIELCVARELKELGLDVDAVIDGGALFRGSMADLQNANLQLRTASRVLLLAAEFHASSFYELERRARKVPWERFVSPEAAVRFRVTARKSKLYHSDAIAQRLGEAVMRAVPGSHRSGSPDAADPADGSSAQLFVVRLAHDNCTIRVDSSGELLHRRGYRQGVGKAPLRETLAAAMLLGSGWDGRSPLVDPLCGSGTIAIEAAMLARKIAPGAARAFAFESWPGHDAAAWRVLRERAANDASDRAGVDILASDRDAGVITLARDNAFRAGVAADIRLSIQTLSRVEFPAIPGWVVTNPPYGVRVGESERLRDLYARLGELLRQHAPGYRVALLSADRRLSGQLRIPLAEVFATRNGGIPVRLECGVVA